MCPRLLNFVRLPQALKAGNLPLLTLYSPIPKESTVFLSSSSSYHEAHAPFKVSTFQTGQPLDFPPSLALFKTTRNPFVCSAAHAQSIKLGFSNDIFANNQLLCMYTRCQLLEGALNLFDKMPHRNVVSWTSMISSCIRSDEHEMGFEIYMEMVRSRFYPNEFTLASILTVGAALEILGLGDSFHGVAFKLGYDKNSFVGTSLLCMYAKCGNIKAAESVFGSIDLRDSACWNAMAESYAFSGYGIDAMRTVCLMNFQGLHADKYTFISALKACSIAGNLSFGKQIHSFIVHHQLQSSTSVMNSLMDMYFRNDKTDCAMLVFERIPEKDIISWNTAVCGFSQYEDEKQVAALFASMLHCGMNPNQVTLSAIFRLCSARQNLCLGLQFICFACHLGFLDHALVVNALISMLSKCGSMEEPCLLFNSRGSQSVIACNEMRAGWNMNGCFQEALLLFCSLTKSGFKSDEFTYNSILSACREVQHQRMAEQTHAKIIRSGYNSYKYVTASLISAYERLGSLLNAYRIFQGAEIRDLACWGAMISAFARRGFNYGALSLFNSAREVGWSPDEFIFGSILNSCAANGVLSQCECVHSLVLKTGYETHLFVASAAIDSFAKCGDINSSRMVFNCILGDGDAIIFNAMITAFAHHGMMAEAIGTLETMRQADVVPTHATFTAVISACRHLGLVKEGALVFDSIRSVYGMEPTKDNLGCLVDLLARDGQLQRAEDVIEGMACEPWPAVWRALLSGCRSYGEEGAVAMRAAEQLRVLQDNNAQDGVGRVRSCSVAVL